MTRFGLKDYWNMLKHRGPKLPVKYFLENHLFDLLNGVNTHERLTMEDFNDDIENLEHGVLYMPSWTSIVKKATRLALDKTGFMPQTTDFIDIGCGKGKVLLIWHRLLPSTTRIVGIDYSPELMAICEKNLATLDYHPPELIQGDVTQMDFSAFKKDVVIYLYNPFDAVIMQGLLNQLEQKNCAIIYNNPVHEDVLLENGFRALVQKEGWHANASYSILFRSGR